MNILVTGANGFIGRRLLARLKAKNHQAIALSQDISKPFSLEGSFDLIVHLAAYNITNVGAKEVDLYTAINVEGTRHLLQAVAAKRFIYVSTAKVYQNEGRPVTEDSTVRPQGDYEKSKLEAEDICRRLLKKEALVILRSVNVIGWGQAPKAVLPVFFQKAKANQALDIIHGAQTPMQFVYVEDLIDAIEIIIEHEDVHGTFNIASQETVSLEQLARAIMTITHSSSVLNIAKNTPAIPFAPVLCDKAYQVFGWKAKTALGKVLELYEEACAGDA